VQARDGVGNETGWSDVFYAYTAAVKPGNPPVVAKTATTMSMQNSGGANPPYTEIAVQCVIGDEPWGGSCIDADGNPSETEVWRTAEMWDVATATGLTPDTNYCWRTKARNGDGLETETSGWACSRTEEGGLVGDMNCDGVVALTDINPFVLAISAPEAWQTAYPDCGILNGDVNGDGSFDLKDINPFVLLLSGGESRLTHDGRGRTSSGRDQMERRPAIHPRVAGHSPGRRASSDKFPTLAVGTASRGTGVPYP
jgi:hypothetical protein